MPRREVGEPLLRFVRRLLATGGREMQSEATTSGGSVQYGTVAPSSAQDRV